MLSCETRLPQAFQLRHPIGGLSASPFQPGANPGPYDTVATTSTDANIAEKYEGSEKTSFPLSFIYPSARLDCHRMMDAAIATSGVVIEMLPAAPGTADTPGPGCSRCLTSPHWQTFVSFAQAAVYYADLALDVIVAIEYMGDEQTRTAGIVMICILAFHTLLLSAIDLFSKDGMGLFGVLLNLSFVRMAYTLVAPSCSSGGVGRAAAQRATRDIKLLESALESTPQLFVQVTVALSFGVPPETRMVTYTSIALSALSIGWAFASKFNVMFGIAGAGGVYVATILYFLADSISRAIAVGMLVVAHGMYTIVWFSVWFLLDFVIKAYQFRADDSGVKETAGAHSSTLSRGEYFASRM